jgi:tRNA A-37 threonylcarbamoyl transferase component Bud32
MCNIQKETVERQLNENIDSISLLKETSCSFLYYVKGKKEYVLKKTKKESIGEEFDNHKKVYECWFGEKENLGFKIPEVYLLDTDKKFYLMEYIKNGLNLLEVLFQGKDDVGEIFRRAGECVNQYHSLATRYLTDNKESILVHNTIRQLLDRKAANKIRKCLDDFADDTYRIIFKDFTLSNIVFDQSSNVYFIDFQKIHYYAPLYYDLARFIDTGRVFSLVRKPSFFLLNFNKINRALNSFLEGYSNALDKACLKKMQYLHRAEHIQMKANMSKLDSMVLKLIYLIV